MAKVSNCHLDPHHPIADLDFPTVTICPPKGSNTALYHDLVKAGNKSLSDNEGRALRESAFDIFIESPHKEYVKTMVATSNLKNLDQVYRGFHSLPKPFNERNGFEIKMWNMNGTITTPWFGEDFLEEYYKEDREFHIILELPENIKEQVGSIGSLVINLEADTRDEEGWEEQISLYTLHTTKKNWTEAETECQKDGGQLASITSEDENDLVAKIALNKKKLVDNLWLGGKSWMGEWSWSDNAMGVQQLGNWFLREN